MQADDVARATAACRDRVDVERRGVAGENSVGPANRFELGKHLALDVEFFEHGLDHEIGMRGDGEVGAEEDARKTLGDRGLGEAALARRRRVILFDQRAPACQRILCGFDHVHGQAAVGQRHRDARAHRARAHDADGAHGGDRRVGRNVGHLGRLALRKESVDARFGLLRSEQLHEEFAFALQTRLEG